MQINFLDEIVSSQCDDVLFFPAFRENQFGRLYCTNFRLCFVPLTVQFQHREPCCSRSLVISDEYQFPLCSVEAIYFASLSAALKMNIYSQGRRSVVMSKKFHLMSGPASQLDIVSCIKIFTKDFRVWTFDLQKSQSAVNLANSIYHFSRPQSLSNFFHVSSKGVMASSPSRLAGTSIAFNNQKDWLEEMDRCQVDRSFWKVCYLGRDKRHRGGLVPSYPLYVTVPYDVADSLIYETLAPSWRHRRFPVWCWSHSNGTALLRSSRCCQELNETELWEKVLTPVCRAHPRNRRPHVVDIDVPTSRISSCFEKLRDFCSIENIAQFNEREKEWCSLLDATGWCSLIFECLSLTRSILHKMDENQRSVVITEDDGYDVSTIVSSLVQICADKYYRTISGLNVLIEKEWIALGHPFGRNIFHCTVSSRVKVGSVSQFFLKTENDEVMASEGSIKRLKMALYIYRTDTFYTCLSREAKIFFFHSLCFWQFFHCYFGTTILFKSSRSCTATFLVFLDCLYQLLRLYPASFEYSQYMLIALWDLCLMGLAPALVCNSVNDQIALERNVSVFPLSKYYSSKYCLMFTNVLYSASQLLEIDCLPGVIQPSANPFDVEFWSECYLRWVSPASIQEGGAVARDLTVSAILANVPSLVPSCESVVWRQRLNPALDPKKVSAV
ncbi:unnamed protein product [Enterobius vermicularis]|uniref:Myotubularin phosphatase domain-containing protein n=1 Tax=Enterobius vermicularis TaxID=51028 RepID=A0A158QA05_ENTVE|nr:unnamed protein product [Enterobius vermicularis]